MYECFPMAYMTETAGGRCTTGTKRVLDLKVRGLHDKSGIILGSSDDVEECTEYYNKHRID